MLIQIQFTSIILYLLNISLKTSRIIISNNIKKNSSKSSPSHTNNDCNNRCINSSSKNCSSINNSSKISTNNKNRNRIKSKKKSKTKITKIKNSLDSSIRILMQIYLLEYQKDQQKKYTQSLNFKHLCSLVLLKNTKTLQGSISIVRKIRKICQYSS